MKKALVLISTLRLLPHIFLFSFHSNKAVIRQDVERWLSVVRMEGNRQYGFAYLMTLFPEFRNLFYKRIGLISKLISWLCPKMNTLFIATEDIGPGLFIQHGFSTIIAAKSIGKNCWINQQVTIGYSNDSDSPVIKDDVVISAGAKIIGNVELGNHSKVGANAVVVKSVPDNCTVVGVPAYIIKKNGLSVKEPL